MAIFAILSKDTEELIFDQLCYNGKKYGKLLFRSYLPSWPKLRIKGYLAKFATLSKTVANDYFDHVCHTEQRYRRSDNLTSFTTLGETQIRWIFAQIYYPGQTCWKNEFWSLLLHWAKMWEITTLNEFAKESKSVQKFIFDRFCPFGQKPDKCQFCYQVWHPCKCLDKVKVILVFTHGANLRQMRHLPPLLRH